MRVIVRLAQAESFPEELHDLQKKGSVRQSSPLASINPILLDGIMCVGGRLRNAAISNQRKHPYILSHRHPFTEVMAESYHRKWFHAGQQMMVSLIRGRFWPTRARDLVRKVIHRCVQCFKVRPKIESQLMADLPPERVNPCIAFRKTGVDYCGPFQIVYPYRRCRPVKCFVAVFICLATKAIHMELVGDLTTQAFIAALRRFAARRNKPDLIMCDNGKNFVGARRELADLHKMFKQQQFQNDVIRAASDDSIEFRFIPARSPNFGGLWESAVKSFKNLYKRTIGNHILEHDHMITVLTQIEAILNSRPLTPLSNDPNDYEALTPAHFLMQRPLEGIREPDLVGIPENRLSAWQRVQNYMNTLWKKWSQEYLSNLQNRNKWTEQRRNLTKGTLVVLKEDNLPPLSWALGRIEEVHPGADGIVRAVTVRTANQGLFKRGICKICVLPIRDNLESPSEGEN
ncbi:uncharacterized protein LOC129742320 [Uranotaenia lowii]|uniref:uncharacterized protein LOC129742320 n=1 Tax=Uranotaenia lowii TaxID=190385 RepID=UPI00247AB1E4|nr:uncharacterized protein LOC129742320 [Uranotaenia lowii]